MSLFPTPLPPPPSILPPSSTYPTSLHNSLTTLQSSSLRSLEDLIQVSGYSWLEGYVEGVLESAAAEKEKRGKGGDGSLHTLLKTPSRLRLKSAKKPAPSSSLSLHNPSRFIQASSNLRYHNDTENASPSVSTPLAMGSKRAGKKVATPGTARKLPLGEKGGRVMSPLLQTRSDPMLMGGQGKEVGKARSLDEVLSAGAGKKEVDKGREEEVTRSLERMEISPPLPSVEAVREPEVAEPVEEMEIDAPHAPESVPERGESLIAEDVEMDISLEETLPNVPSPPRSLPPTSPTETQSTREQPASPPRDLIVPLRSSPSPSRPAFGRFGDSSYSISAASLVAGMGWESMASSPTMEIPITSPTTAAAPPPAPIAQFAALPTRNKSLAGGSLPSLSHSIRVTEGPSHHQQQPPSAALNGGRGGGGGGVRSSWLSKALGGEGGELRKSMAGGLVGRGRMDEDEEDEDPSVALAPVAVSMKAAGREKEEIEKRQPHPEPQPQTQTQTRPQPQTQPTQPHRPTEHKPRPTQSQVPHPQTHLRQLMADLQERKALAASQGARMTVVGPHPAIAAAAAAAVATPAPVKVVEREPEVEEEKEVEVDNGMGHGWNPYRSTIGREKREEAEREREKEIEREREIERAKEAEREREAEAEQEAERERERERVEREKSVAMQKQQEAEKEKEREREVAMAKERERQRENERGVSVGGAETSDRPIDDDALLRETEERLAEEKRHSEVVERLERVTLEESRKPAQAEQFVSRTSQEEIAMERPTAFYSPAQESPMEEPLEPEFQESTTPQNSPPPPSRNRLSFFAPTTYMPVVPVVTRPVVQEKREKEISPMREKMVAEKEKAVPTATVVRAQPVVEREVAPAPAPEHKPTMFAMKPSAIPRSPMKPLASASASVTLAATSTAKYNPAFEPMLRGLSASQAVKLDGDDEDDEDSMHGDDLDDLLGDVTRTTNGGEMEIEPEVVPQRAAEKVGTGMATGSRPGSRQGVVRPGLQASRSGTGSSASVLNASTNSRSGSQDRFGQASLIAGKTNGLKPKVDVPKSVVTAAQLRETQRVAEQKRNHLREQRELRLKQKQDEKDLLERQAAEAEKQKRIKEAERRRREAAEGERRRKEKEEQRLMEVATRKVERAGEAGKDRVLAAALAPVRPKAEMDVPRPQKPAGTGLGEIKRPLGAPMKAKEVIRPKQPTATTSSIPMTSAAPVRPTGPVRPAPSHGGASNPFLANNPSSQASGSTAPVKPSQQARASTLLINAQKSALTQSVRQSTNVNLNQNGMRFNARDEVTALQRRIAAGGSASPQVRPEDVELPDIDSDFGYSDSDSDRGHPKKKKSIADWVSSPMLKQGAARQEHINPDDLFGKIPEVVMDDLFPEARKGKFRPRSSSANWGGADRLTLQEELEYANKMGYQPL